jgi:tetratricopeptide (TPR) repeat protein
LLSQDEKKMSKDWFRNETWNDAVEAAFRARLKRARDKAQYRRIQAYTLRRLYPEIALRLLDEYFLMNDRFDWAQAYGDQAEADLALGQHDRAIASYEQAIAWQTNHPNVRTNAARELAVLIADQRIKDRYTQALELLDQHGTTLLPLEDYEIDAARALILNDMGRVGEAKAAAQRAISAAARKHSGLRYHAKLGLVEDDRFGGRLREILKT